LLKTELPFLIYTMSNVQFKQFFAVKVFFQNYIKFSRKGFFGTTF